MNILWAIVVVLIVLALLGAPGLGIYQHNWGYAPSGLITLLVIVLVVLLVTGRL